MAVLNKIREYAPTDLYIAGDAARTEVTAEAAEVQALREKVMNAIDWPCNVRTRFAEENLGCGRGPAAAISWFFDNVESGVILEDDVLPDLTFFSFCNELLHRYKDQADVMHIGGHTLGVHHPQNSQQDSFYFSKFNHCWGWATWRRAWQHFQYRLDDRTDWEKIIDTNFETSAERTYWKKIYCDLQANDDIWDYQWTFKMWEMGGKAILPVVNLVKNIGFQSQATHTFKLLPCVEHGYYSSISNISYPALVETDSEKDLQMSNFFYDLQCCVSPITGTDDVTLEMRLPLSAEEMKSSLFRNLYEIRLYRCNKSGYRFYFPGNLNIEDDDNFSAAIGSLKQLPHLQLNTELLNSSSNPLERLKHLAEETQKGEVVAVLVHLREKLLDYSADAVFKNAFRRLKGFMDKECFCRLAEDAGFTTEDISDLSHYNSSGWTKAYMKTKLNTWLSAKAGLRAFLPFVNIVITALGNLQFINKKVPAEYSLVYLKRI